MTKDRNVVVIVVVAVAVVLGIVVVNVVDVALASTSDARPGVNDHLRRVVFDTPSNFPC